MSKADAYKYQPKIKTENFYEIVKKDIEAKPDKQLEFSLSKYAKLLDVSHPTIRHHYQKLIDSGDIIELDREGKYGRKFITTKDHENDFFELELGLSEEELFEQFIKESQNIMGIKVEEEPEAKEQVEEVEEVVEEVIEEPVEEPQIIETPSVEAEVTLIEEPEVVEEVESVEEAEEVVEEPVESVQVAEPAKPIEKPQPEPEAVVKPVEPVEVQPEPEPIQNVEEYRLSKEEMYQSLSLDDKIESFLQRTNNMYDAGVLLNQRDKEILSVMYETIQRNILYLKDLSDELGTVENRELIKSLIDEREAKIKEIKELQEEVKMLRERQEIEESQKVNPQRARELQQRLVASVAIYLNGSSESLALKRNEFKKTFIEDLSELVNYMLGIQK